MKKIMTLFLLLFFMSNILYSQNYCDSLYVYHKKIKHVGQKGYFTGFIDCNSHYRNTQKLPNIHHVIFFYTQHAWYNEAYEEIQDVRAVGNIVKGKEEGKWQYYKTDSDTLLVECYFLKGRLSGTLTVINKNGETHTEEFVRGKKFCKNRRGLHVTN